MIPIKDKNIYWIFQFPTKYFMLTFWDNIIYYKKRDVIHELTSC